MPLDDAFATPDAKRRYVRRLFATIAHRYDFFTRAFSYGQDGRWKARLVRDARVTAADTVLDLACGTGDIALAMAAAGAGRVIGLDITPRMIALASRKGGRVRYLVGDMTALPIADASIDVVSVGYGLRNVPDLETAIAEVARVLRPGGRFLSLDFNRPESKALRSAYLGYLTVVGSTAGWLLHGDADTYRYIPASIRRYPGAAAVAARLAARGFDDVETVPLLMGLMTLHRARRHT